MGENYRSPRRLVMMEEFLTPKELAKRRGVSVKHLAQERWKEKGPKFVKWGWTVLYPKVEVVKWEKLKHACARD